MPLLVAVRLKVLVADKVPDILQKRPAFGTKFLSGEATLGCVTADTLARRADSRFELYETDIIPLAAFLTSITCGQSEKLWVVGQFEL